MMIKNIFSIVFLVVSIITVRSMDVASNDERELKGNSKCTKKCKRDNPCKPGITQFYFEHCRRRKYIQCDESGGCFEKRCPKGTRWNQDFQTCVHKRCGECRNNCRGKDIAKGKLYKKHCTDETKFRQCDKFGGCFVMDCPPGTVWKNKKKGCVHA